MKLSMKKTLVLLYPGCIANEVFYACEKIQPDFPVEVMTLDGSDHLATNGMIIKAQKALNTFQLTETSNYQILLVPGGDPALCIGLEKLNQLISKFHQENSICAAICAGPILLDQAGILAGKSIAHGYKGKQLEFVLERGFFKNAHLAGLPVQISKNIITAKAEAFTLFADEIVKLSKTLN